MIPFVDFGGDGPPLHLAHANGYPPETYAPLAEQLTARYRVTAMRARPPWASAALNGLHDWQPLADDFLRLLKEQGARRVVGVGHSLSAVRELRRRRPEAEYHPVAKAGRLVPLEKPAAVGQAILSCLERI